MRLPRWNTWCTPGPGWLGCYECWDKRTKEGEFQSFNIWISPWIGPDWLDQWLITQSALSSFLTVYTFFQEPRKQPQGVYTVMFFSPRQILYWRKDGNRRWKNGKNNFGDNATRQKCHEAKQQGVRGAYLGSKGVCAGCKGYRYRV